MTSWWGRARDHESWAWRVYVDRQGTHGRWPSHRYLSVPWRVTHQRKQGFLQGRVQGYGAQNRICL
jgi:hypothetical protein